MIWGGKFIGDWNIAKKKHNIYPVGKKKPNDWGFYDMHGNILEWCEDLYGRYPRKVLTDPKGPPSVDEVWAGAVGKDIVRLQIAHMCTRDFHVLRGGGRSAEREVGTFPYKVGFRLCCSEEAMSKYRKAALLASRKENRQMERRIKEKKSKRNAEGETELKSGNTKTFILPGGAKMEMIYCAPGSFMMGSPKKEKNRKNGEILHKVTLTKGFWLGKYPVTQRQWECVMQGSITPRFSGSNKPKNLISWEDCQKFIAKINSKSDLAARFPTEAEWEYACRAGSRGAYSGTGNLDDMGWYTDNRGKVKLHPVGKKLPNDWGFYDMHGNVCEWCEDWHGSYSAEEVTDPKGLSPEGRLKRRVVRGGAYYKSAGACRSASRSRYQPDSSLPSIGFRLCCSAEPHE